MNREETAEKLAEALGWEWDPGDGALACFWRPADDDLPVPPAKARLADHMLFLGFTASANQSDLSWAGMLAAFLALRAVGAK